MKNFIAPVKKFLKSRSFILKSVLIAWTCLFTLIGALQFTATMVPSFSDWIALRAFGTITSLIVLIAIVAWLTGFVVLKALCSEWRKHKSSIHEIYKWVFITILSSCAVILALSNHTIQVLEKKDLEKGFNDSLTNYIDERKKAREEIEELRKALVQICRRLDEPCQNLTFGEDNQNLSEPAQNQNKN